MPKCLIQYRISVINITPMPKRLIHRRMCVAKLITPPQVQARRALDEIGELLRQKQLECVQHAA